MSVPLRPPINVQQLFSSVRGIGCNVGIILVQFAESQLHAREISFGVSVRDVAEAASSSTSAFLCMIGTRVQVHFALRTFVAPWIEESLTGASP